MHSWSLLFCGSFCLICFGQVCLSSFSAPAEWKYLQSCLQSFQTLAVLWSSWQWDFLPVLDYRPSFALTFPPNSLMIPIWNAHCTAVCWLTDCRAHLLPFVDIICSSYYSSADPSPDPLSALPTSECLSSGKWDFVILPNLPTHP